MSYAELRDTLVAIAEHCEVVGLDLVEVNPTLDVGTGVTSYLAAHTVLELPGQHLPSAALGAAPRGPSRNTRMTRHALTVKIRFLAPTRCDGARRWWSEPGTEWRPEAVERCFSTGAAAVGWFVWPDDREVRRFAARPPCRAGEQKIRSPARCGCAFYRTACTLR